MSFIACFLFSTPFCSFLVLLLIFGPLPRPLSPVCRCFLFTPTVSCRGSGLALCVFMLCLLQLLLVFVVRCYELLFCKLLLCMLLYCISWHSCISSWMVCVKSCLSHSFSLQKEMCGKSFESCLNSGPFIRKTLRFPNTLVVSDTLELLSFLIIIIIIIVLKMPFTHYLLYSPPASCWIQRDD